MKILILGSGGLIGNTMTRYFFENTNHEVFGMLRDESKLSFFKDEFYNNLFINKDIFDYCLLEKTIKNFSPNFIINCIGITNKINNNSKILNIDYMEINALFPRMLLNICKKNNIKLIQFSSDCVFSGKRGFYSENDYPDPLDIYGKSKFLGELDNDECITIRKSAIGHEINSKNGLLEWFLAQNQSVNGYRNAIFSGLTVLELSKIISSYIIPNPNLKGIFHIASEPISKYNLLKIIAKEYQKDIKVLPNDTLKIDRSLNASFFNKLTGYKPKSWLKLIESMNQFNKLNYV